MELEVLYHGTKFKKTADKILKEGFAEYSYFAKNLNDAIGMGGKYIFQVVFLKTELPDYWQVRCENQIPPHRIIRLDKFIETPVYKNQKTEKTLFSNADEYHQTKPYVFKENGKIEEVLKMKTWT